MNTQDLPNQIDMITSQQPELSTSCKPKVGSFYTSVTFAVAVHFAYKLLIKIARDTGNVIIKRELPVNVYY